MTPKKTESAKLTVESKYRIEYDPNNNTLMWTYSLFFVYRVCVYTSSRVKLTIGAKNIPQNV